jgi:hypothetical protein
MPNSVQATKSWSISHESDVEKNFSYTPFIFSSRVLSKLKGAEAMLLHVHDNNFRSPPVVGKQAIKVTTMKVDKSCKTYIKRIWQWLHLIKKHKYESGADEKGSLLTVPKISRNFKE